MIEQTNRFRYSIHQRNSSLLEYIYIYIYIYVSLLVRQERELFFFFFFFQTSPAGLSLSRRG